jgi:hypothetical protein
MRSLGNDRFFGRRKWFQALKTVCFNGTGILQKYSAERGKGLVILVVYTRLNHTGLNRMTPT